MFKKFFFFKPSVKVPFFFQKKLFMKKIDVNICNKLDI